MKTIIIYTYLYDMKYMKNLQTAIEAVNKIIRNKNHQLNVEFLGNEKQKYIEDAKAQGLLNNKILTLSLVSPNDNIALRMKKIIQWLKAEVVLIRHVFHTFGN